MCRTGSKFSGPVIIECDYCQACKNAYASMDDARDTNFWFTDGSDIICDGCYQCLFDDPDLEPEDFYNI